MRDVCVRSWTRETARSRHMTAALGDVEVEGNGNIKLTCVWSAVTNKPATLLSTQQ
jgi:hypothetical protein